MSEAEPVSGTVFISDDDDDLDAPEDEWLNDGFTVSGAEQHPYLIHAAHIQHQLTLCYGLLCALPERLSRPRQLLQREHASIRTEVHV